MEPSKTPTIYAYIGGITLGVGISILTDNYVAGPVIGVGIAFLWVSLVLSKTTK